jgi:molybdopterin/thiamine biosynthesis adenylyltransferase
VFDYQEYRNKYSQHIMFYEAGVADRQRVYNARVAVIGVGRIGIEASRLIAIAHVQLLRFIHWGEATTDGTMDNQVPLQETLPSGMAAIQDLAAANPSIALELVDATAVADFRDLLRDIDLVLYEDGDQDRCALISGTCRELKKPWIYAEARGGSGKAVNVIPGRTACIDCVKAKVQFDDKGLRYGPTVTDLIARIMSQVQAMEALKILGISSNISADVFCFDVDSVSHTLTIAKDEACPCCTDS